MSQGPCETYNYSNFESNQTAPKWNVVGGFNPARKILLKIGSLPASRGEKNEIYEIYQNLKATIESKSFLHLLQRQLVALPSILHRPRFCSPSHRLASTNAPWSRYVVEPPPQEFGWMVGWWMQGRMRDSRDAKDCFFNMCNFLPYGDKNACIWHK